MRAREPDRIGHVERDGVSVGYEVFGDGDPTIVLLTSWAIVHMRQWKAQVPYLSRHFRVITVEGRGNGLADRPDSAEAYTDREYVDDVIAVMDATGTDRAVLVGLSLGGRHALQFAAWYPERAAGVVAIGTALPWPLPPDFDEPRDSHEGWDEGQPAIGSPTTAAGSSSSCPRSSPSGTRSNIGRTASAGAWRPTPRPCCTRRPRSTPPPRRRPRRSAGQCAARSSSSTATATASCPYDTGVALARWTGGELVTIRGGGHAPPMREPVLTNQLIRDFAEPICPEARTRACLAPRPRPRAPGAVRLLAIGLGHVRRDWRSPTS